MAVATGAGLVRWAFSRLDYLAHVLTEDATDPVGVVVARCGHRMPNATVDGPAAPGRCAERAC